MADVTKQLGTLTELLEGESNNSDVMDDTSDIEEEDIITGKEIVIVQNYF